MSAPKPIAVNIVSSYFHPDFPATGQVVTDLAIGLKQLGCEVSAYAPHVAYGQREQLARPRFHQGIPIHHVFCTHLDKNSTVGRILNTSTFFVSAFFVLLVRRTRGPLLIVSHPPFLALAGVLLKWIKGQRFVYLVHDVYPDIAVQLGYLPPEGPIRRIWDQVNRLIVRQAASVVVLGESMKEIMRKKAGGGPWADPARFHVIHNWADGTFIRPVPKSENPFVQEHGLQDTFVVLYSGNMGLSHDLETVIAAAERLRDRNMVFLFIGDGGKRPKLEAMAKSAGLTNVRFLPYQPRETLPFSAAAADVSLVALEKGIEGLSMPSKLYTLLASGRAVVGLVEKNFEVARIIETAGCGQSVAPSDVDGLTVVLDHYVSNPEACARDGLRGREYFEAHFTRARAVREYYEVLRAVQ